MRKEMTSKIASEILIILAALALFCVLTCLWPLVFLVIPVILIAALRLLFIKIKIKPEKSKPAATPANLPRPNTEQDVVRTAFGILQRRIAEGNMLNLNKLCQAAFASGVSVIRIPEKVLPAKESWDAICAELKRVGFTGAAIQDDGIHASF